MQHIVQAQHASVSFNTSWYVCVCVLDGTTCFCLDLRIYNYKELTVDLIEGVVYVVDELYERLRITA